MITKIDFYRLLNDNKGNLFSIAYRDDSSDLHDTHRSTIFIHFLKEPKLTNIKGIYPLVGEPNKIALGRCRGSRQALDSALYVKRRNKLLNKLNRWAEEFNRG